MDERKYQKKKHWFFDLDNTLTRSRSPATDEMVDALTRLAQGHTIVVVSGAVHKQILQQMTPRLKGLFLALSQSGNVAHDAQGQLLWERVLCWRSQYAIYAWIENALMYCDKEGWLGDDLDDLVQDRVCQVSFSPVGHNADLNLKEAFDPDHQKRQQLLKSVPFESNFVDVRVGGTTCLDFTIQNSTKGTNIKHLCEQQGWDIADCVYVGDALNPGGNDESVIGVCDTVSVLGPIETLAILKEVVA